MESAERAGVAVELVERESFGADFDRLAYTHRVVDALKRHEVDLVAMAGFRTILEKPIHDAYPGRIMNTHPSLLPAFKGWHAVDDALAAGRRSDRLHRAPGDARGRRRARSWPRRRCPVRPDDTAESLHERIKEVERRLYPAVLRAAPGGRSEAGGPSLSVCDKAGLVEFARGLHELGFELVSSGGTAAALAEAPASPSPPSRTSPARPRCSTAA